MSRWGPPVADVVPSAPATFPSRWGPQLATSDSPEGATEGATRESRWGPQAAESATPHVAAEQPRQSRWGAVRSEVASVAQDGNDDSVAKALAEAARRAAEIVIVGANGTEPARKSRWADDSTATSADLSRDLEIAALRAEMLADSRGRSLNEAVGKGRKGKGDMPPSAKCSKWVEDWRARIHASFPHGEDAGVASNDDVLRSTGLEIWQETVQMAAEDDSATLSLFAYEAGDWVGSSPGVIGETCSGTVLLFGDDPWYLDNDKAARVRGEMEKMSQVLAGSVSAVGTPQEEVSRIWMGVDAAPVKAVTVLRLDGLGPGKGRCFGEDEVAAEYKKLSRVVHPDKTRGMDGSHEAFERLRESADELKRELALSRETVRQIEALLASPPLAEEDLKWPQAALFVASLRYLMTILGLNGEGRCNDIVKHRAALAFYPASPSMAVMTAPAVIESWYSRSQSLNLFSTTAMRTAYECAPKQYRAQFICALSRLAWTEGVLGVNVRDEWKSLTMNFPEVEMWQCLEAKLRQRVWETEIVKDMKGGADREKRRSRSPRHRSRSRSRKRSRSGHRSSRSRGRRRRSHSRSRRHRRSRSRSHNPQEELENVVDKPLSLGRGAAAVIGKWVFVPISNLLLAVGECSVGVAFDGPYVMDMKKIRKGGIWLSVKLPPGMLMVDFEAKALVDEFGINDLQVVTDLLAHCAARPNAKSNDIMSIRAAIRNASRGGGTVLDAFRSKVREILDVSARFSAQPGGGGGRGKGGKAKGCGGYGSRPSPTRGGGGWGGTSGGGGNRGHRGFE